MVSCITPLTGTCAKDRSLWYGSIRPQALISVHKTVNTGVGSKIIGPDTGSCIYVRPSGRGQNLDRCQVEETAVNDIQVRVVFRERACPDRGEEVCVEEKDGRESKGVYVLEGRELRQRQGRGTRDAAVKGMGKGREGKTHS